MVHTTNANAVRGRPYEFFYTKIYHTRMLLSIKFPDLR